MDIFQCHGHIQGTRLEDRIFFCHPSVQQRQRHFAAVELSEDLGKKISVVFFSGKKSTELFVLSPSVTFVFLLVAAGFVSTFDRFLPKKGDLHRFKPNWETIFTFFQIVHVPETKQFVALLR